MNNVIVKSSTNNLFWRTPNESQRADQNSAFFGVLGVRDGMCDWAFTNITEHEAYLLDNNRTQNKHWRAPTDTGP